MSKTPESGAGADQSAKGSGPDGIGDLATDPGYETGPKRISLFWKICIGVAVIVAGLAAAGIGGAIVRITCESDCAVPYAGGIGLGLVFGGFGTLILAVLVARSMQEWTEWHARQREAAESIEDDSDPT